MFAIAAVDYANSIRIFKERKYKIVVIFLYEESSLSFHYSYQLAVHSDEINSTTGNHIAFLTHHAVKSSISKDYTVDDDFPNGRGFINWDRNEIEKELKSKNTSSDPYVSMRNVAKAFGNGMENRLPCLVILNPNCPETYVEKSAKNIAPEDIFGEISRVFIDIQVASYDIQKYSERFKEPYYYLPAHELLERNLNSIKYGIHVAELVEAIKNENLANYFNLKKIESLSENGYIPTHIFFENLCKIKCEDIGKDKNLDKSALISLLEKHASFHCEKHPQRVMLFKEIKNLIEPSSIDYLAVAGMFMKGSLKNLESSSSMVAICLGKVIEDELNLGVFNVFRGAFSVSLPKYFNKVQTELDDLVVSFNGCPNPIRFNGRDRVNSSRLDYPITSDLRKIAFGRYCSPIGNIDNSRKALKAKSDISNIKNAMDVRDNWDNIFTNLKNIAETRNDAIHKAQPLSKEELKISIDSFDALVNIHFFEVNNELKKIVRNQ